jgi:hypothetical protein
MTEELQLTPLEQDLFERFHARHAQFGFPAPSDIRVLSRENTGAGRYTHIAHEGELDVPDDELGLGTYSSFAMTNLHFGASFWVVVESRKASYLEIVLNGPGHWDGTEGEWAVCDPDTGELERPIQELPYEDVDLPRRSWWERLLDRMFGL